MLLMPADAPPAKLALEDGTVFVGLAFGAFDRPVTSSGEVLFNTAMTGYQEALSDPSYAGQILTFTAPMIGNYGVCIEDVESSGPQVSGVVVRELARLHSNPRAVDDLSHWLWRAGVLGLQGIDTRALVRRLRTEGAMRGAISSDSARSDGDLIELARSSPSMVGWNLAAAVSPTRESAWRGELVRSGAHGPHSGPYNVLVLDCGCKQNIYRSLAARGCAVTVAPHDLGAERIREINPDGIVVSNGPGDPQAVAETIETLRAVAGEFPTFGICLGHQMLAVALGAKSFKLKFGHRGANQPVRNLLTGQVEITSQNHGFCVDAGTLAGIDCEVTHVHLNDGTMAGFRHRSRPIFSVQFHPEASPGPHDSGYLFDCFVEMMRARAPIDAGTMRRAQTALRGAVAPVPAATPG